VRLVRENRPLTGDREILTVGHSTHPIERFEALLGGAGVEGIADVRRFPGSRRNPQFGREALGAALGWAGIAYEWLGEELGGRRRARPDSSNDAWRVAAFRGYADYMEGAEFALGLARLEALASERRTAFICAEGDWRRCHRRLIADALSARGWHVVHLLADGRRVDHELPGFATVAGGRVSYASQPAIGGIES
jgi:uncharacterized protein (DUF488 family)